MGSFLVQGRSCCLQVRMLSFLCWQSPSCVTCFPHRGGRAADGPVLSSLRALMRVFCRCFFRWRAFPFFSLLRFLSEDTRVVWPSGLQCWFGTQSLWRQGFTSHCCQGARLPGGPCVYNALTTTTNSRRFLSDAHVGFYGMFSHLLRRHCSRF